MLTSMVNRLSANFAEELEQKISGEVKIHRSLIMWSRINNSRSSGSTNVDLLVDETETLSADYDYFLSKSMGIDAAKTL